MPRRSTAPTELNLRLIPDLTFKDTAPPMEPRITVALPASKNGLEYTVALLTKYKKLDHFAYERDGIWYIGIGSRSSLQVDPKGEIGVITGQGKRVERQITGCLTDFVRKFVAERSQQHDGKIFGHAGFNYGAHVRGQKYTPGRWPLLSIMVPQLQVVLGPDQTTIQGYDAQQVNEACDILKCDPTTTLQARNPQPVDVTQYNQKEYKEIVSKALAEIQSGKYTKVIASRAVDINRLVDMPATLLHGRRANTPARTYVMKHGGFQVVGFSPELVMAVVDGKVHTEPLAGTRAKDGSKSNIKMLADELIHDPKEIVEHVISVKEAVSELERFCVPGTVNVKDLMGIKERGSVQHLGSGVHGQLSPESDSWSAFNVLFPSITASGIPKNDALRAIDRLETRPRELYSGSILLLDAKEDFFEATLCLRIVLQDATNTWIQAGAGIIEQSNPDREFTETVEKLGSIAPYIVYEGKGSAVGI